MFKFIVTAVLCIGLVACFGPATQRWIKCSINGETIFDAPGHIWDYDDRTIRIRIGGANSTWKYFAFGVDDKAECTTWSRLLND